MSATTKGPNSNSVTVLFGSAHDAMKRSHSPYSNHPVGAALRVRGTGEVYAGVNVESRPNESEVSPTHAEESAIAQMVRHSKPGEKPMIDEIVVVGPGTYLCTPCGGCRDRILEFADADTDIHVLDKDGNLLKSYKAGDLLPGHQKLDDPARKNPTILSSKEELPENLRTLYEAAKEVLGNAHTSYLSGHRKVAAALRAGSRDEIFRGVTVQGADFRMTPAAQTAIGAMVTDLGDSQRIKEFAVVASGNDGYSLSGLELQRLREFSNSETMIHVFDEDGNLLASNTMDELLPDSFGPENVSEVNPVSPV